MSQPHPQRVRVTSPRIRATPPRALETTREIDDQTPLGAVYMRSLLRSQLRLGLLVVLVLAVTLGGLPLLFWVVPESAEVRVAGVQLPWLLLGVLVYPCLVGLGWFYVRQSERNERDFTDLVERR